MTDQPRRIERELLAAGGNSIARLQLILFQALTSATPVDTGFARASLTPAVGSPIAETLERPELEEDARREAASRFNENRARSFAISSTYGIGLGSVFLTYRAAYVVFLNEGSSAQAPKKFVERGIAVALRTLGSLTLT